MNGAAGVIGSTVLYGIGITALQHYNYELRCYPSLKSTKHAAHGATISAPIALDTRSSVFQGAFLAGLAEAAKVSSPPRACRRLAGCTRGKTVPVSSRTLS